jgi:hypothetical protein
MQISGEYIGTLIALVIVNEAIVELIVESKIFFKPRTIISRVHPWIASLLSCGYCFSVWPAFFLAFYLSYNYSYIRPEFEPTSSFYSIINHFVIWMLIHRLSNAFHGILSRIFERTMYTDEQVLDEQVQDEQVHHIKKDEENV